MPKEIPPEILRSQAQARLHVVDGFLAAFANREGIVRMVWSCDTSEEALLRLMAAPFGFSDVQAHHILDRTLRWQTKEHFRALEAERSRLTQVVD
jgi:DNA gyrase/topoisomerase IV subunit A